MRVQSADAAKSERVNLRIDRQTKELIEQAAAMDHRSLTGFIVDSAKRSAVKLLARERQTLLSRRDWDMFVRALQNPPKPNKALRTLFSDYRKHGIRSDV